MTPPTVPAPRSTPERPPATCADPRHADMTTELRRLARQRDLLTSTLELTRSVCRTALTYVPEPHRTRLRVQLGLRLDAAQEPRP